MYRTPTANEFEWEVRPSNLPRVFPDEAKILGEVIDVSLSKDRPSCVSNVDEQLNALNVLFQNVEQPRSMWKTLFSNPMPRSVLSSRSSRRRSRSTLLPSA